MESVRRWTGCNTEHNVIEMHWEYSASDGARKGGQVSFRSYCKGGTVTQKIKPGMIYAIVRDPETGMTLKGPAPRHHNPGAAANGRHLKTVQPCAALCNMACSSD